MYIKVLPSIIIPYFLHITRQLSWHDSREIILILLVLTKKLFPLWLNCIWQCLLTNIICLTPSTPINFSPWRVCVRGCVCLYTGSKRWKLTPCLVSAFLLSCNYHKSTLLKALLMRNTSYTAHYQRDEREMHLFSRCS